MTVQTIPYALQNASHSAALFRQSAAAAFVTGGALASNELLVSQQGTPNMSVILGPGRAKVLGSSVSVPAGQRFTTQAMYDLLNDADLTITVAASNPTNPRIDVVYVGVRDTFYSGANNDAISGIVTGTPSGSPVVPAIPANAIAIAYIAVGASVTSIVTANISRVVNVAGVIGAVMQFPDATVRTAQLTVLRQGMLSTLDTMPGVVWQYYDAYNASTNPFGTSIGGTPTAGWFPVSGSNIFCALTINNSGALTNATEIALGANTGASPTWVEEFDAYGFHAANSTQVIPSIAGRYSGTLNTQFASNATGLRLYRLRRNATPGPNTGSGNGEVLAPAGTGLGYSSIGVEDVLMNGTTDYFEGIAYQASGGTLAVTARLVLRYDGPPVGP
jgi:hypothetical protein